MESVCWREDFTFIRKHYTDTLGFQQHRLYSHWPKEAQLILEAQIKYSSLQSLNPGELAGMNTPLTLTFLVILALQKSILFSLFLYFFLILFSLYLPKPFETWYIVNISLIIVPSPNTTLNEMDSGKKKLKKSKEEKKLRASSILDQWWQSLPIISSNTYFFHCSVVPVISELSYNIFGVDRISHS